MKEIKLRQFSASICDVFEELLDKYNITIPDENRRADNRRQNAERNLSRRGKPGNIVHNHKKRSAEQHRRRDETLIVMPEKHPRKVRDDEADPADHTAHGNAGGRDERSAHDDRQTKPRCMHTETARFLFAERQQIDAPAQQEKRHHADERRDKSKLQIARLG